MLLPLEPKQTARAVQWRFASLSHCLVARSATVRSRREERGDSIRRALLRRRDSGATAATPNRHLTFPTRLLDSACGRGLKLDSDLSAAKLRARDNKEHCDRNARLTIKSGGASRVFATAPFAGCKSWEEALEPGEEIHHRPLSFAPVPLYCQGGRREEFYELEVNDVILDKAPFLRRRTDCRVAPNRPRSGAASRRSAPTTADRASATSC